MEAIFSYSVFHLILATIMGIIIFCRGVQLFSLGIIGEYLAKTYYETRKRPLYIIRKSNEGK